MKSSSTPFSESFKLAELSVSDDPSSTKGLTPEALCTSPEDLECLFSHPLIKGTWVDLGSGYGHTVHSYQKKFPDRVAIGIEREPSRLSVARNRGPGTFIEGDLLFCEIPQGDIFFLYFPQGHVLDRILSELLKRETFILVAIESHGDLFPRLEKETWLECVDEIPLMSVRHHPSAKMFIPKSGARKLQGLHPYSFRDSYFLVKDESGEWWGDSFGLYASGNDYLLQHPPRTVREQDVVKIVTEKELSSEIRFLVALRRAPDVRVISWRKEFLGPIRKIHSSPGLSVEFPSGERLQWTEIDCIYQGPHLCYDSSSRFFSSLPVR